MKQLLPIFLLLAGWTLAAQQFPVTSQVVVRPPSSVYLSDFTEPGSQRLGFNLTFNDANEPEYDVRLHLRLEGNGVVLETSPNFHPGPITLFPGGPRELDMFEWGDYLDPANLTLVGLDQAQFISQGGKLPEGMYQLCLTVRDFRRPDVDLSRETCTVLNLRKNNPPLPFVPVCGGVVQPTPTNQVQLNWQANHDALVNARYTIDMVKVDDGVDPNQAILSGAQRLLPDVEIDNQTSYTIDPSDPLSTQLIYGETYAYRVNVTDLDGLTTFENDGQGEVCWFTYGFLPGGVLGVNYPQQDNRLRPADPLVFRWSGPTNATAGTNIYYNLRVVDITDLPEGTDPETAFATGGVLIDELTPVTGNLSSWNFPYDGQLETERTLAWRVEAYVDGSEGEEPLAESEVVTFTTTPLIDRFRAGQYTVLVNTAGESTLADFSGTGTLRVNDTLNLDVAFQNLVLEEVGTNNVLVEGLVDVPLNEEWPLDNPDGGSAFLANRLLLDRDNLRVEGRVRHLLGLLGSSVPASPGLLTYVQSEELLLSFEGGVMDGGSGTFQDLDFQPFDLPGLTIKYREMTYEIAGGAITYSLSGSYELAAPVAWMEQEDWIIEFNGETSFYDQVIAYPGRGRALSLTEQDSVNLMIRELAVDLRYGSSPAGLPDVWVGFWLKTGNLTMGTAFDSDGAIVPLNDVVVPLDEFAGPVLFTPRLGLELDFEFPAGNQPRASFYGFLDDWLRLALTVEEGSLTYGQLEGDVLIPFLDDETPFEFTAGISDTEVTAAWLSSIEDATVEFTGKQHLPDDVTITVNSGHFGGNDRLVLNIDVYLASFDASLDNLSGFTIWGDGATGFDGERHGIKNIADQEVISVANFPGNLKSIAFSYQYATETPDDTANAPPGYGVWNRRVRYLIAYEADVNFGIFLSSLVPGDAPKTAFSLDEYRDLSVLLNEDYESDLEAAATSMPDEWTDYWEALQAQDEEEEEPDVFNEEGIPLLLASVATSAIPGVANVSVGNLEIFTDEEDWGTMFGLETRIELLRPFAANIDLTVFAGHTPWTNDPSEGFAYTAVKLSVKDGTAGSSQGLDNQLAEAKTKSVFMDGSQVSANDNMTSNFTNFGPLQVRYLALGVFINMNYDGGGNLQPSRNSYGGLLGFRARMMVPPGGEYMPDNITGKRRIELGFKFEMIINASLGMQSVAGELRAKYTEDATTSSTDGSSLGANYAQLVMNGSFDWNQMLMRSNVAFDLSFAPYCISANAGVDFQLDKDTKKLRMLDVRLGSYDDRITVEYCVVVSGGGTAGAGGSVGLVAWLNLAMRYGIPASVLAPGADSYADIDPDLAYLDDLIDDLEQLTQAERDIITTALESPADLPPDITGADGYDDQLREWEQTYGTQVWAGELGLGATASIEARTSQWIDLVVVRFMPFFSADVTLAVWGNMQFAPVVVFNELGGEMAGNATIGVYYEELDGTSYSGNYKIWTFAAIHIVAQVIYDVPERLVSGDLSAQIQMIELPTGGYLIDATAEIPFEFTVE